MSVISNYLHDLHSLQWSELVTTVKAIASGLVDSVCYMSELTNIISVCICSLVTVQSSH